MRMDGAVNGKKPGCFSNRFGFYTLFWIFFAGCFLGVVLEIVWFFLTHFSYENRTGLVYGPFNLVYGAGALGMTVALHPLEGKRTVWLFLAGCAAGSALEFGCSWVQEALFGTVSWDYRAEAFQLDGRIHLSLSLVWGALGVLWVKRLCPALCACLARIPDRIARPLTWGLAAFLAVNILVSAAAASRMTERLRGQPAENAVESWLDEQFPNETMEELFPNLLLVDGERRIPIRDLPETEMPGRLG